MELSEEGEWSSSEEMTDAEKRLSIGRFDYGYVSLIVLLKLSY